MAMKTPLAALAFLVLAAALPFAVPAWASSALKKAEQAYDRGDYAAAF